eukprot:5415784-Amphidinium_carterae.2
MRHTKGGKHSSGFADKLFLHAHTKATPLQAHSVDDSIPTQMVNCFLAPDVGTHIGLHNDASSKADLLTNQPHCMPRSRSVLSCPRCGSRPLEDKPQQRGTCSPQILDTVSNLHMTRKAHQLTTQDPQISVL